MLWPREAANSLARASRQFVAGSGQVIDNILIGGEPQLTAFQSYNTIGSHTFGLDVTEYILSFVQTFIFPIIAPLVPPMLTQLLVAPSRKGLYKEESDIILEDSENVHNRRPTLIDILGTF